jgi:LemA protein
MKSTIIAIVVVAAVVLGIIVVKYNGIVGKDVAVQKAWAPLLIKLKERYSPIPRMIVDITFYASQKPPLAVELESNKDKVAGADTISKGVELANNVETDLMKLLQWVQERYPGIMSKHTVSAMVENLAQTEAVLGPDMTAFNTAAEDYNAFAQRFPANLVAKLFSFPPAYPFFQPRK